MSFVAAGTSPLTNRVWSRRRTDLRAVRFPVVKRTRFSPCPKDSRETLAFDAASNSRDCSALPLAESTSSRPCRSLRSEKILSDLSVTRNSIASSPIEFAIPEEPAASKNLPSAPLVVEMFDALRIEMATSLSGPAPVFVTVPDRRTWPGAATTQVACKKTTANAPIIRFMMTPMFWQGSPRRLRIHIRSRFPAPSLVYRTSYPDQEHWGWRCAHQRRHFQ
jgi:hypothetical protein